MTDSINSKKPSGIPPGRGSINKEHATMSNILDFKGPEPPAYEPPKSKFGRDETYLKWCAEWRAARAQHQKNWAEHQAETMWGTLPDAHIELDLEPLNRMKELENILAEIAQPRTMLLARELLYICVTILAHAHEDPESNLSQGPVLKIVRNVISSLDWCEGDMSIGKKEVQS